MDWLDDRLREALSKYAAKFEPPQEARGKLLETARRMNVCLPIPGDQARGSMGFPAGSSPRLPVIRWVHEYLPPGSNISMILL